MPRQPTSSNADEPSRTEDAFDIRKPAASPGSGGKFVAYGLLAAGITFLLLVCVLGAVGVAVFAARDTASAKIHGTWKGRFFLNGQAIDAFYTFNRDGTFHDEEFDIVGQRINNANGRWRLRDNRVEITWDQGRFEKATVHWINGATIDYHILEHSDAQQVGIGTTFQRQDR